MACVWEKDWYGYYECNTAPKHPDSCSKRCEEHVKPITDLVIGLSLKPSAAPSLNKSVML